MYLSSKWINPIEHTKMVTKIGLKAAKQGTQLAVDATKKGTQFAVDRARQDTRTALSATQRGAAATGSAGLPTLLGNMR